MTKKGMKRALVLALTLALAGGGAFTSYAKTAYSEAVEEQQSYVKQLEEEISELENSLPDLQNELEEAQEAYDLAYAENPNACNSEYIALLRAKSAHSKAENELNTKQNNLKSAQSQLEYMEESLEQQTKLAYDPASGTSNALSDELRALDFTIIHENDNWILRGQYRRWNSLMGGSWEYNKGVSEDLEIGFYIDGECVESSLSRAESYDTETAYAWEVPFDLEYSTVYKIEINNIKFSVSTVGKYGRNTGTSTSTGNSDNISDTEDTSTEQETTAETTNSTATTDYPGFYDVTLADSIPNQTYYAQSTDGGWVVSLGGNFEEYSEYDKSKQRGSSDLVKGWLFKDGKWYAFDSIGHQVVGWMSVGGYWYCVYPGTTALESCMLTGWQEINDGWYYFNTSGQMVANCVVDGYTIGADGLWIQ